MRGTGSRRRMARVGVGAVALALSAGAVAAALRVDRARPVVREAPSPVPAPSPEVREPKAWPALARVGKLTLTLPAPHPVAVAFHQASFPEARALEPVGRLVRNANRTMFEPPPDAPGPAYIVMSARGRGTPATSSVDVVVRPGTPIRSPVTGQVVRAERYRLYGRYQDWRVEIVPEGRPDLRVVLIHLARVGVRRGDPVSVTLSVIGYARELPFRSQVDDYVTGGDPHVHIEVKESARAAAPPS